ncbi:hypothetical protein ACUXV3_02085 [Roseobacteraceae bacterium NS-SX3]
MSYLELFGIIQEMVASAGIACERRVMDPDIQIGTRTVNDGRFADGNLHILNERYLQMPNVLNSAVAYLSGFWHLDPRGCRAFSSIGAEEFRENMIPYKYAKQFYGRLKRQWKDQRRSFYNQQRGRSPLPEGAVSVFFQGEYPRKAGATRFSDIAMLRDVLEGAGDRPVLVKPHPQTAEVGALVELGEIAAKDRRVIPTNANVHDILEASCVTVSVNSAVAMEGFLHRTPAILYGISDFHHFAETVTAPGRFAGALERAQQRTGGYAQFMTWYYRRHCLEVGQDNLEERIWSAFAKAGFPRERFLS